MIVLQKKKNNGVLLIVILLLLVIGISVGYSALSERLEINGSSNIGANASWAVNLANVKVTSGAHLATKPATLSGNVVSYAVDLKTPGDVYEFTVDVLNTGTIPAKLSSTPVVPTIPTEHQPYVKYSVTYADTGTALQANDTLPASTGKKTVKVRLEFRKDINALPSTGIALNNLNFAMNYVQQ